jgi:hypothetical protein
MAGRESHVGHKLLPGMKWGTPRLLNVIDQTLPSLKAMRGLSDILCGKPVDVLIKLRNQNTWMSGDARRWPHDVLLMHQLLGNSGSNPEAFSILSNFLCDVHNR